jgi:hypothetical protein
MCVSASTQPPCVQVVRSHTRASCYLTLDVWRSWSRKCRSRGNSTVVPYPNGDPTPVPSPASCAISDVTAGSGNQSVGAASILSARVMPTLMPIGSRNPSVAVGPTGRGVFRRRSQTWPVRLRTLSGNAVGGGNPPRGFESLSLRVALSRYGFGPLTLQNIASKPTHKWLV